MQKRSRSRPTCAERNCTRQGKNLVDVNERKTRARWNSFRAFELIFSAISLSFTLSVSSFVMPLPCQHSWRRALMKFKLNVPQEMRAIADDVGLFCTQIAGAISGVKNGMERKKRERRTFGWGERQLGGGQNGKPYNNEEFIIIMHKSKEKRKAIIILTFCVWCTQHTAHNPPNQNKHHHHTPQRSV